MCTPGEIADVIIMPYKRLYRALPTGNFMGATPLGNAAKRSKRRVIRVSPAWSLGPPDLLAPPEVMRATILHELGHFLLLGHWDDVRFVMGAQAAFPWLCEAANRKHDSRCTTSKRNIYAYLSKIYQSMKMQIESHYYELMSQNAEMVQGISAEIAMARVGRTWLKVGVGIKLPVLSLRLLATRMSLIFYVIRHRRAFANLNQCNDA